jgi:hypothetical protein
VEQLQGDFERFAQQLAERQAVMMPAEDPDYGDTGQAFPAWETERSSAVVVPPQPHMPPAPQLQAERDADRDAG